MDLFSYWHTMVCKSVNLHQEQVDIPHNWEKSNSTGGGQANSFICRHSPRLSWLILTYFRWATADKNKRKPAQQRKQLAISAAGIQCETMSIFSGRENNFSRRVGCSAIYNNFINESHRCAAIFFYVSYNVRDTNYHKRETLLKRFQVDSKFLCVYFCD